MQASSPTQDEDQA
jgi:hypothetical protein